MEYELWKKIETVGCEMEDGSDTRETNISFMLIPLDEKESFDEYMANDYGTQDYSYTVHYRKITSLDETDISKLLKLLKDKGMLKANG